MPYFFIPPGSRPGDSVTLSAQETHHIKNVFRFRTGQALKLSDGQGKIYEGEILSLGSDGAVVKLLGVLSSAASQSHLSLASALLKRDKMELVIQKATELGIRYFQPMTTSRTIVKPGASDKLSRWQKIADEACKQCGRPERMTVLAPKPFAATLIGETGKIIFWEEGGIPLRDYFAQRKQLSPKANLTVYIGPEGGFEKAEVTQAQEAGCSVLSLGDIILKAETAAIVATTLIQYELGNL